MKIVPAFAPAMLALSSLCASPSLSSGDDTLQLKAESGYACVIEDSTKASTLEAERLHGGYALIEMSYAFTNSWVLHMGYQGQWYSEGRRLHRPLLGLRYQLDIFEYIPWIGIQAGYDLGRTGWEIPVDAQEEEMDADDKPALIDPLGDELRWGLELGLDRRLDERHVIGGSLRWTHISGLSDAPGGLTFGIFWAYRWQFIDPFK